MKRRRTRPYSRRRDDIALERAVERVASRVRTWAGFLFLGVLPVVMGIAFLYKGLRQYPPRDALREVTGRVADVEVRRSRRSMTVTVHLRPREGWPAVPFVAGLGGKHALRRLKPGDEVRVATFPDDGTILSPGDRTILECERNGEVITGYADYQRAWRTRGLFFGIPSLLLGGLMSLLLLPDVLPRRRAGGTPGMGVASL